MKIFLRPVTLEDCRLIAKWRNSTDVNSHCFDKTPITVESCENFYKNNVETGKYKQFIVECIDELSGVVYYPIATVYLKDIDISNKRCELCIFTSDDVEWNTENQSIAIEMLLKKAFEEYGIHKVYTYVFANFTDEIGLIKRSGFIEEALLKGEAIDSNGKLVDVYRFYALSDVNKDH